MDPIPSLWLLGLVLCFVLTAIASAADAALTAISRHRLASLVNEDAPRARRIRQVLDDPARLKASTLVIDTFAKCAATALTLLLLFGSYANTTQPTINVSATWWQRLLGVIAVLLALLLLGEALPKILATAYPDRTALLVARPIQVLSTMVRPITLLVDLVATPFARMLGVKQGTPLVTEEELKLLVNVGEEEGLIEREEREMIEGILLFGDTLVREVMVPRIDIAALDVDSSVAEAVDFSLGSGHSRIPVYEETMDRIAGILYIRDLMTLLRDNRHDVHLREHLRPVHYVPETMKVDSLLRDLKTRKVHLAIAVDEYGGTAGLVTIEDLLEEIVGEIQDEYDTEEPLISQPGPDTWIVDARVSLDDLNEETGLNLTTEEGDSVGGLVYEKLGTIPQAGDSVEVGDVVITVQSVQGLRPEKLELVLRHSEAVNTEEPANAEHA